MNASAASTSPTRAGRTTEKVVNFSADKVRAPFFLRCGAAIIDYILVAAFPTVFLLIGRYTGEDGASLLNSELNNIGWLLAIFVGISNLILLPAFTGRTLGKFATGLRTVASDGSMPRVRTMLFRQIAACVLVPLTAGLELLTAIFSRKGRALHDYIAGTVVIFANKRPFD